jgi:hypothetical protein
MKNNKKRGWLADIYKKMKTSTTKLENVRSDLRFKTAYPKL